MNGLYVSTINPQVTPSFRQKKTKEHKLSIQNIDERLLYGAGGIAILGGSVLAYRNHSNDARTKLAKDLSRVLGKKITTKQLASVMTKDEMLKELPKLTEQNFVASKENISNGTFIADLHGHTNFSDGKISVEELLNQAAEYADKLNKKNGKKFFLAITDHDGIEGTKEALKIIAQNPKKYKNIKFLPASEVSFAMPCHPNSPRFARYNAEVQMPEMLIYNINPFSKESEEFFQGIKDMRKRQVNDTVSEANRLLNTNLFNAEEFYQNYEQSKKHCFTFQHWKLYDYLNTKTRVAKMAKEQNRDANSLYAEIMSKLKIKNSDALEEYINNNNIQTSSEKFNDTLSNFLKDKIFPQIEELTKIKHGYENDFERISNYAQKENAIMGFAHPAFTMENFADDKTCLAGMKEFMEKSNGRILMAEKYHQAYPIGTKIEQAEVDKYNRMVSDLQLINIGGRDNHEAKFLPQ